MNYNIEYNINVLFFRIDFLETLTTRCITRRINSIHYKYMANYSLIIIWIIRPVTNIVNWYLEIMEENRISGLIGSTDIYSEQAEKKTPFKTNTHI